MLLTVLGTGSGGPFHGRHYTSQVLQVDNQYFLIDCGEGMQMQAFHHRVKVDRVNQIFISHLHGDHVFGLIGLLTSWCLKRRTETVHIFSPPGLYEMVSTTARLCHITFPFPIQFTEIDASMHALVFENNQVEVWSIPLMHRMETSGWLFREKKRPDNILKSKIDEYGIHYSLIPGIKAGGDLELPDGRVIPHSELTVPAAPPRSYAFCSDTAPSDTVVKIVQGVDLLYHEATFNNEHLEEARISFHSTAAQAAEIARKAGVQRLLLGHFSGRYESLETHLMEARAIFDRTDVATDGCRVHISPEQEETTEFSPEPSGMP
ncbi:MAG: ribonuclease Z [Saprospiraceae bacterium]|nr:ribonuclease Z [Saprospiraceae bacterium]